jgi:hypothetical protein
MKVFFVIAASLALSVAVTAKSKPAPPFAQLIDSPTQAKVLAAESSHESKYLGFNWVNSYCFGVLGCAVTNEPATAEQTNREAFLRVGPWIFDLVCTERALYIHPCGEISGDFANVKLDKNGRGLDILSIAPDRKSFSRTTFYAITSAINTDTQEIWGNGTVDGWRTVRAEIAISEALRKMKLDAQIVWYQKLQAMHAYGLATPENLEAILAEMTHSS